MNKEDEFSCIASWIKHRMPKRESVIIRFKANSQMYQAKIGHNGQRLYVNKPILMITVNEPTLYNWQEEETYNTLKAYKNTYKKYIIHACTSYMDVCHRKSVLCFELRIWMCHMP